MPRIALAFSFASAGVLQNFTPPALPRPPACTWAFTITGTPYSFAIASAAAGVVATCPSGIGTPNPRRISFAWYS